MQSVYKFPIAMVMLHEIDKGNYHHGDNVTIDRNEYIPDAGHSPIVVKLTLIEMLEYNVSHSDGTANDFLLRLSGHCQVPFTRHKQNPVTIIICFFCP